MRTKLLCLVLIVSFSVFSQVTYKATKSFVDFKLGTMNSSSEISSVRISKDYASAIFSDPSGNIIVINISNQLSNFGSSTRYIAHIDDKENTEVLINIYSRGLYFYMIEYETKTYKNIYLLKQPNEKNNSVL